MKYIIIIFVLLILFIRFIHKYDNPYQLICIFGKKGVGKTSYLVKLANKYRKRGVDVYANIHIPDVHYYDVGDIGLKMFPPESVVFIDEVGIYFNGRNWKNFGQNIIRFFKLQRHYRCTVICTSQALDMDKSLRDLFDCVYLLRKIFNIITIVKPIYKTVGISNDSNEGGKLIDAYSWGFGIHDLVYLPHWVGYFDSFDIVKLPTVKAQYEEITELQKELRTITGYLKIKYSRLIKSLFISVSGSYKSIREGIKHLIKKP